MHAVTHTTPPPHHGIAAAGSASEVEGVVEAGGEGGVAHEARGGERTRAAGSTSEVGRGRSVPASAPARLADGPRASFGVSRLGELRGLLGEPEEKSDEAEPEGGAAAESDVPFAAWLHQSVVERLQAKEKRKEEEAAARAARPPIEPTFEGIASAFDMPLDHVHMAFWFEKGEVPGSNFGEEGRVPVIPKLLARWATEAHFAVPEEASLPREPRRRDPTAAAMDGEGG